MQKRKQFTLGIITLLLLCILAGCQFGNQKKKTEKKVDYYIGVVDNNAPYYYKDADGTEKGLYVTFLDKLSKEQSFTYMFVPMDISASEQSLSEQSVDGFIGSTVVKPEKRKFFLEVNFTHQIFVYWFRKKADYLICEVSKIK